MDSIFSDDEEFDAFRDQLFDGHTGNEDEKVVPMYGSYAILKKEGIQKHRQDLFLRPMEAPSNDLMPYESGAAPHKKVVMQKTYLEASFSYFGMKENRIKMVEKSSTVDKNIAERNELLKKLKAFEDAEREQEVASDGSDEDYYTADSPSTKQEQTPVRKSQRKRKRVAVSSSSENEEEEEDPDSRVCVSSSACSPRRKRASRP